MRKILLAVSFVTTLLADDAADAVTIFDFEGAFPTSFADTHPGELNVFAQTKDGLGIEIRRNRSTFDTGVNFGGGFIIYNSDNFDIVRNDRGDPKPASFGLRSLDPFYRYGGPHPGDAFRANFSSALSALSIDMGDYGGDADALGLIAYSGVDNTGDIVASASFDYSTSSFPTFATLSVSSSTPFRSVRFNGGVPVSNPNSVFYDNITATVASAVSPTGAIPEPGAWSLMIIGFGFIGAALRGRRGQLREKGGGQVPIRVYDI